MDGYRLLPDELSLSCENYRNLVFTVGFVESFLLGFDLSDIIILSWQLNKLISRHNHEFFEDKMAFDLEHGIYLWYR